MTYYVKSGTTFTVTDEEAIDLHKTLPPGNYIVKYIEPKDLYYLEQTDNFTPMPKLYGDMTKNIERIHSSVATNRPSSSTRSSCPNGVP